MKNNNFIGAQVYQELQLLITKNCFEIFELVPSFNIDKNLLTKLYYQKQKIYHPDNFIRLNSSSNISINNNLLTQSNTSSTVTPSNSVVSLDSTQIVQLSSLVLQVSSYINDAYYILVHDLPRALALLEVYGIKLDLAKDTSLPHEFLIEQMEVYEAIDGIKTEYTGSKNSQQTIKEFEQIQAQVQNYINNILLSLHHAFETKNLDKAVAFTKQLSCYLKLKSRIVDELDKLT